MARIRMIKPEFWDDEKMAAISRDARLTFIGIWNNSDDYGVVKGHPLWLKNKIFPYDEIKPAEFQRWLQELENINCIIPYEANGEKYYYIRTFGKHQTINRPSQVKNPTPPCEVTDGSLNAHGVLTSQIKLKEIKLKEVEGDKSQLPRKSFLKPTMEEILTYCRERNNTVSAQVFINHYESNGWMVGKNKMKDWKAAVRTWETRGDSNGSGIKREATSGIITVQKEYVSEPYERPSDDQIKRNVERVHEIIDKIAG